MYIGNLNRVSQDGSETAKINISIEDKMTVHHTIDNPSFFFDHHAKKGTDKSGILLAGLEHGMKFTSNPMKDPGAVVVSYLTRKNAVKGWDERVIFRDDGSLIKSASAAVLVPLDPGPGSREGQGDREGWLFVTGFWSAGIVAVKVDL